LLWLILPERRWVASSLLAVSTTSFMLLLMPHQRIEVLGMHDAAVMARGCALNGTDCNPRNMWLQPTIEIVQDHAQRARAEGVW